MVLAACLWLLAWLFAGVVIAAAWAVMRGHGAALAVLLAAAFAAVVLALVRRGAVVTKYRSGPAP